MKKNRGRTAPSRRLVKRDLATKKTRRGEPHLDDDKHSFGHEAILESHFTLTAEQRAAILSVLEPSTPSPWAILLVRFSDQTEPSPALAHYQDLFTGSGAGRLNMVDFFRDMSHSRLDLSGSRVFGWYTLSALKTNYVGNTYPQPEGKLNRNGLVDAARAAATAAGVNLSDYAGVVVSALGAVDLCGWVGGMTALCDSLSLQPSLLGQEMGHGYGLDHARHQTSSEDYRDPWDVMSTGAYPGMEADNADWTKVGPGLNAYSMRSRGWLNEERVWKSSAHAFSETIELRPLHFRGLPGWLAAQVGHLLVEFRVPERWDAAIGRACVLVHSFDDNHSYLLPSTTGNDSLQPGDKFEQGNPLTTFAPHIAVQVESIDARSRIARVKLQWRWATIPQYEEYERFFGGVLVDGGGFVFHGGRIIKVPPRGPVTELMQHLARYLDVQIHETGVDRAAADQRDASLAIIRSAARMLAAIETVTHQPPGYGQKPIRQPR